MLTASGRTNALEAIESRRITSGRILAIRRSAKPTSCVLSDGHEKIQVYIRWIAAGARLQDLQAARLRRLVGVEGRSVPDEDERAHDLGVAAPFPLEVSGSPAGEVARPTDVETRYASATDRY